MSPRPKPKLAEFWYPLLTDKDIAELGRHPPDPHSESLDEEADAEALERLLTEHDRRLSYELKPFVDNWQERFPLRRFIPVLAPYVSGMGITYDRPSVNPTWAKELLEDLTAGLASENASMEQVVAILQARGYGLHPQIASHAAWVKQRGWTRKERSSATNPVRSRRGEWKKLKVQFRGEREVTIRYGGTTLIKTDFSCMGFATYHGEPSEAWRILYRLAQGGGIMVYKSRGGRTASDSAVRRQVTNIKRMLKDYMQKEFNLAMEGEPITFHASGLPEYFDDKVAGWKTTFSASCEG